MPEQIRSNLSRRTFFAAGGTTVAVGATATGVTPWQSPASASAGAAASAVDPVLALNDIQGNIIGGFNKDFQRFLFFRIRQPNAARQWLGRLVDEVASSAEVMAFNGLFKQARARRGGESSTPTSSWVNVAFTHTGLAQLRLSDADLARFPQDFREGMAARAVRIGDVDGSAPTNWVGNFASPNLHGVLLLAADSFEALWKLMDKHRRQMVASGLEVTFDQTGLTREDQPGHEHFGFRDGISQPGIRGVTARQNPDDEHQGLPGQDLLWPGEFVLGYDTQIAEEHPEHPGGVNPEPGPPQTGGPAWAANGSYLVFRRLNQDVEGFRGFVREAARQQGMTDDQFGAKIVGRYPSGAPLEHTDDQSADLDTTAADPSIKDPSLLEETRINDFEFGDDVDGAVVPIAAHIRKTYPRDDQTPTGGESDTQTHRLLRRGIPFGLSYDESADRTSPTGAEPPFPTDRGLLFLAYQTSIERQFEFVQNQWVNNPDAPASGAGHDLVMGQADATRTFHLPGGRPEHITLMERFVTTSGGAYFFQPSIPSLRMIAGRSSDASEQETSDAEDRRRRRRRRRRLRAQRRRARAPQRRQQNRQR